MFYFSGLMGIPADSSQQTHTSCSYQHSPSGTISSQNSLSNNQSNSHPNSHSTNSGQVPLSHPAQAHPGHGSPHAQHLSQHGGPHNQHSQHAQHSQHSQHPQHQQHSQHPQHAAHSQHGQHPSQHQSHSQHPQQHTPHPSQHTQHSQHPSQHGQQHQSLSHQPHPTQQQMACNTGKALCLSLVCGPSVASCCSLFILSITQTTCKAKTPCSQLNWISYRFSFFFLFSFCNKALRNCFRCWRLKSSPDLLSVLLRTKQCWSRWFLQPVQSPGTS